MANDSEQHAEVPPDFDRLKIRAAFLQRLFDTALVLEAEVAHLRLKEVFDPAAGEEASGQPLATMRSLLGDD